MKIKARDIKVGDTVGQLKILNEMEPEIKAAEYLWSCRLFMCSCACGNIIQRLDTELEQFPPFRQCDQCMKAQQYNKDLWEQFIEIFTEQDQLERKPDEIPYGCSPLPKMGTKLFQVFTLAQPKHFDEYSRTLTVKIMGRYDQSAKSFIGSDPREFLAKNQHRWLPITQKLNFNIKFVGDSYFGLFSPHMLDQQIMKNKKDDHKKAQ